MNKPTGVILLTENSNVVTGTGTNFDSQWEGKWLKVGNNSAWYEIEKVVSTTSMELKMNYLGPTASGQSYIIGYDIMWKRTDLLNEEDENTKAENRGKFSV